MVHYGDKVEVVQIGQIWMKKEDGSKSGDGKNVELNWEEKLFALEEWMRGEKMEIIGDMDIYIVW